MGRADLGPSGLSAIALQAISAPGPFTVAVVLGNGGRPPGAAPFSNRGSADRLPELRTLLQDPGPVGDFDDRVDLVFEDGDEFANGV